MSSASEIPASTPPSNAHLGPRRRERMVLVVVPHSGYGDEALRHTRSCLHVAGIGSATVSTRDDGLLHGAQQDFFQPDGLLAEARLADYVAVVFCGGPGALELAEVSQAQSLARETLAAGKLLGTWGEGLHILVKAGVLRGRKVTGCASAQSAARAAGARYTGTQIELDGSLLTALDDAVGMRFGRALARFLR